MALIEKRARFEIGPATRGDRVRAWTRMLDEHFMRVECSEAGDDLRASVWQSSIDQGSISRVRFTRQKLRRPSYLLDRTNQELAVIALVKEGAHLVRQGNQEAVLCNGGLYILDDSRPFEVCFVSDVIEQCTIVVPKSALVRRIGPLQDIAFGPGAPLQKLVAGFMSGIVDAIDDFDGDAMNSLLDQTLDLIGLMIAARNRGRIDLSTHRAGTLTRLKAFVHAHLADEALTIDVAAKALGISSRYVNSLLAAEGTSFGRYILAERLDRARRDIMDPRRVHRQVSEVAFDWGFKNASHFARSFKDRYGMSPRDARHRTS